MENTVKDTEILIIDDDEMSGLLAITYLKKKYLAENTTDPKQALLLCSTRKYRAILLDIDLGGGIRGEDVIRQIRSMALQADTPVIAMTGFSGDNEKTAIIRAGFNGYITKPYSRDQLLELLQSILERLS